MNRSHAQRLLWERREDLMDRLHNLNEELGAGQQENTQELSMYDNHPADLGSETFEREKDLGLREMVRDHLLEVDAALHRLEEGSYGVCTRCSEPIGDARLEALPEAEYCMACQSAYEKKVANRRRPSEEDVLDPTLQSRQENSGYDAVDVWEDVAQHGTSYSPQDQLGAKDFDDLYLEEESDDGTVERVDRLPRRKG